MRQNGVGMYFSGWFGSTYPAAPWRFGSLTSRGSSGVYGTWLNRWLMMLSRPRFLSSVCAMCQGAQDVSVAASILSRARE